MPGLTLDDDEAPPRRAGPRPVTTMEELRQLDEAALFRGYTAGRQNAADFAERDRGYWHGYLNGLVDGGHAKGTEEQAALARLYLDSSEARRDAERLRGAG